MDTLRGTFESDGHGDRPDLDDIHDLTTGLDDSHEEGEAARDLPPAGIGQDERRMQVRAYNHWASLLGERTFPSIEDLEPTELPDFGPHSVLLDFSVGIDDPIIQYLGAALAHECSASTHIQRLSDVPPRSLLSRITDHYLQIMANQAPIGFEAEFVNQRGASILYRGILLPFSSDDESIDFIYGVINWKEMADAATADELLLEIDQALDADEGDVEAEPTRHHADPIGDWADSPAHEAGESDELMVPASDFLADMIDEDADQNVLDLGVSGEELGDPDIGGEHEGDLPMPDFGQYTLDDPEEDPEEDDPAAPYSFASLADYIEAPSKKAVDLDAEKFDPEDYQADYAASEAALPEESHPAAPVAFEPEADFPPQVPPSPNVSVFGQTSGQEGTPTEPSPEEAPLDEDASIHDCLASARELARSARVSEDRSRHALYAAVGRAYDFSLAAKDAPKDYDTLIEESGLTVQDRAPMTPVVKLVFGSDYDKTRLTEYAAVLNHAHRLELERGALADFLSQADGGLKGVVTAERRLRREESGKPVEPEHAIREALAKKLRELEALTMEAISAQGPEFSLVMVRRDGQGSLDVIGEIADDTGLIERAARKLVG
ncbi:MAG: hypothetical protein AAF291_10525 [Pseudomonadota bacterium]